MGRSKKSQKRKKRPAATQTTRPRRDRRLFFMAVLFVFVGVVALLVYWNFTAVQHLPLFSSFKSSKAKPPFADLFMDLSPRRPPAAPNPVSYADFVGSKACQRCHPQQYTQWQHSAHGKAGGRPGEVKIISPFNGPPLHYKDATVTPVKKGDSLYYFKVERTGRKPKIFRVAAVIGGGHMVGGGTQTYFTSFPDGTLRFLPFDFNRNNRVWFSQTRDSLHWIPVSKSLALSQLSEWPPKRVLGTTLDFPNCQNCHGSQISIDYDPLEKHYRTRFTTLAINCESCHGPGRRHVDLMQSGKPIENGDIGLASLATMSKDASLQVCFQCHAVKDPLKNGYLPGMPLESYYSLKLPMLAQDPYQPDGRIRRFGYQQNHLYSDCYLNGSMTCVDCHAPHSLNYRDIWGQALPGRFNNGQCTDCHPSKALHLKAHTHHGVNSPGSLCTSCHMPYLQHPSLGKRVKFTRSDHTIPIPRPQFDARLGIENACSKCHPGKSVASLQAKVDYWYGRVKPHKPIVKALFDAAP
ncbi:MAG: hypothetical protein D6814_05950, partial [Calditrichaeota bacterium]